MVMERFVTVVNFRCITVVNPGRALPMFTFQIGHHADYSLLALRLFTSCTNGARAVCVCGGGGGGGRGEGGDLPDRQTSPVQ